MNKPRNIFSALLALICALVFFSQATYAQTTAFTYQGRLTDAGNPASGNYLLEFRLYTAAVGGTQIGGNISDVAVTATNGVFTTRLDFGANAFPGTDRFLEISVRRNTGENYTVLSPRQQINSSPYAIRTLSAAQADLALNSNKLGGSDASQYVTTTSVGNSFIRNSTTQQTGDFNISGSGIVGGNLGIGTTAAPRATLDVAGNAVQSLSSNGFVKAMALVTVTQDNAGNSIGSITRCFNAVLNSSTENCGFTTQVTQNSGSLRVRVNFGFTVSDRFVSFNELDVAGNTTLNTSVGRIAFFDSTTVQVIITPSGKVFIFVF